jgi:hypothetical protein
MRSTRFRFTTVALTAACLAGLAAGCGALGGSEPAHVTGRVTIRGKPLAKGTITFVATDARPNASSLIGPDGAYDLKTNTPGDGVLPGEYRVVVSDVNPAELLQSIPGAPPRGTARVRGRYENPDTTDLKAVVKPGQNTIPFDLK